MATSKDLPDDCFNILVATDIHLGYAERDQIRGQDSFLAFEEVLKIAREKKVDLLLLGGDLFHENKPSRQAICKCIQLLRQYCLTSDPIRFEFVSDSTVNFKHSQFPHVNFHDRNLNVGLPVFTIHGNHDDPTGNPSLCALDMLHETGLINMFGKVENYEAINIKPLLLEKGKVKLAIFGLGAVRDERLHNLFFAKKVQFHAPLAQDEQNNWFNLLVLHQNREKRGEHNYIPETFLPSFLDLVIWGHEHPCRIKPEFNAERGFHVSQPGSTVATALSEGEAGPKYVGLLTISGGRGNFALQPIQLHSPRQFYFDEIILAETTLDPKSPDSTLVENYCEERVKSLINTAAVDLEKEREKKRYVDAHPSLALPLIRVRVDCSGGFEPFNTVKFGVKFVKKVANPKDIILITQKREPKQKVQIDSEAMNKVMPRSKEVLEVTKVEDMVEKYFAEANTASKMRVLSETGLGKAVKEFVDKMENAAIDVLSSHQVVKLCEKFKGTQFNDVDELDFELQQYREQRDLKKREIEEAEQLLKSNRQRRSEIQPDDDSISRANDDDNDDDEEEDEDASRTQRSDEDLFHSDSENDQPPAKRGRGRGRGSRGGRGTAGSVSKSTPSASGRGGKGSRGGRGGKSASRKPLEFKASLENFVVRRDEALSQKKRPRQNTKDDDDDDDFSVSSAKTDSKRSRAPRFDQSDESDF